MHSITRQEYSELILSMLKATTLKGEDVDHFVELRHLTETLAERDPWSSDECDPEREQ